MVWRWWLVHTRHATAFEQELGDLNDRRQALLAAPRRVCIWMKCTRFLKLRRVDLPLVTLT